MHFGKVFLEAQTKSAAFLVTPVNLVLLLLLVLVLVLVVPLFPLVIPNHSYLLPSQLLQWSLVNRVTSGPGKSDPFKRLTRLQDTICVIKGILGHSKSDPFKRTTRLNVTLLTRLHCSTFLLYIIFPPLRTIFWHYSVAFTFFFFWRLHFCIFTGLFIMFIFLDALS